MFIEIGETITASDARVGASLRSTLQEAGGSAVLLDKIGEPEPTLLFRFESGILEGDLCVQTNAGLAFEADEGFEAIVFERFGIAKIEGSALSHLGIANPARVRAGRRFWKSRAAVAAGIRAARSKRPDDWQADMIELAHWLDTSEDIARALWEESQ